MRVVLDTNILVSGMARPLGNPSLILNAAMQGKFSLYLSNSILAEFARVVPRKFRWDSIRTARVVRRLSTTGILVKPPALAGSPTGHPPDDHILACAVAADADFLVTGDKRHLLPLGTFGRTRIITAAEFILELEQADGYAAH